MSYSYDFSSSTRAPEFRADVLAMSADNWEMTDQGVSAAGSETATDFVYWCFWRKWIEDVVEPVEQKT